MEPKLNWPVEVIIVGIIILPCPWSVGEIPGGFKPVISIGGYVPVENEVKLQLRAESQRRFPLHCFVLFDIVL